MENEYHFSKAGICAILFIGLGQVYNKDYKKALYIWAFFIFIFILGLILGGLMLIILPVIYFYSVYDAIKTDRENQQKKQLRIR